MTEWEAWKGNEREKTRSWHYLNIRGVCKLWICSLETDSMWSFDLQFQHPFRSISKEWFHTYDRHKWGHSVHCVTFISIHNLMFLTAFSLKIVTGFLAFSRSTVNVQRRKHWEWKNKQNARRKILRLNRKFVFICLRTTTIAYHYVTLNTSTRICHRLIEQSATFWLCIVEFSMRKSFIRIESFQVECEWEKESK